MSIDALARIVTSPGRHAIPFVDEGGNPDRPITLHVYRPQAHTPDMPVVFLHHGVLRNGDEYRDIWIPAAERHGLLIVAPTFSREHYAEPARYNNGFVFGDGGQLRPSSAWTYEVPGRVLALLRSAGLTNRPRAHLFGHSAGGQFVQRLLGTQPHDVFECAMAASAGWYTLPRLDLPFPEGLGGIGMSSEAVERLLGFPLTILIGGRDNDDNDSGLPRQPEAMRQGPNRFARAHSYYLAGRFEAQNRGVTCNWRLIAAPGIDHDSRAISAVAAMLWFENRMPDAAEIDELRGQRLA